MVSETYTTTEAHGAARSADEDKRERRRLALLKRSGFFNPMPSEVRICRATSFRDLRDAYGLVHDVFLEQGYINPMPGGLRIRPHEALPETATFVAKVDAEVVGVQSLIADTRELELPSDHAFRAEINSLRDQGRKVCEAANESVAEAYRRTSVPGELMRGCFAHALAHGFSDIITAVSPGHGRFYELLGFEQLGNETSFSDEIEDVVVLMRLNLEKIQQRVEISRVCPDTADAFVINYYVGENPYRRSVAMWAEEAAEDFANATMIKDLFIDQSDLLSRCSWEEIVAVREHWGEGLFHEVLNQVETVVAA
jgi:N-acyl amino acid synthase FeeM